MIYRSNNLLRVLGGISVAVLFLSIIPLHAERRYYVGHTLDLMGGMSNQVGNSSARLNETDPYYAAYPSINLTSASAHSKLDLGYTFSVERFMSSSETLTTTSHMASFGLTTQLGSRARLHLSDSFDTRPNYSTINVLKGFAFTPQGFQMIYEPQFNKRFSLTDSGSIGLDLDLTPASYISFEGRGSYRHYGEDAGRSYYSNQLRGEGNFSFSHRHSRQTTWTFKYSYWQNEYEAFATSRSHSASIGLSHKTGGGWAFSMEAGPAYVQTEHYTNYRVNVTLAKQGKSNRFDAGYSHNAGDSTGIGGSSESHQGRLGFSKSLGRKTSINFQGSGFRQNRKGSANYDYWGATGSAALSQQIGRFFVASAGVSYTTNLGQSGYSGYTYKRAYVSVGYRFPELFKAEK